MTLEHLSNTALTLARQTTEAQITTDADLQMAGEVVTAIKRFVGTVEEQRSAQTGHLYKEAKQIEAKYKPMLKQAEQAMQTVQQKMLAFRALQEQQRQQAMLAAATAAPAQFQQLVATGAQVAPQRVAGVVFGEEWVFEVTDPLQVPGFFWCIDTAKLQEYVNEHRDRTNVPGVKVTRKEKIGQVRKG